MKSKKHFSASVRAVNNTQRVQNDFSSCLQGFEMLDSSKTASRSNHVIMREVIMEKIIFKKTMLMTRLMLKFACVYDGKHHLQDI